MGKILLYVGIFWAGGIFGYLFFAILSTRMRSYAGAIVVSKTEDKLTYSLELIGDPEELQFEHTVTFKVVSSEENEDRN